MHTYLPHCPPTAPTAEALFLTPISFSSLPVKVPTRRTFVDPQSCGDPLQAVHLFAKELDAKSVTLEKSLGTGKLGTRGSLVCGEAPPPPHATSILLACLHPKSCPHLCRPGLHPVPMLSRKLPPPHQAGPLPTGSREGGGRGICDPAFLPFACPQGQNSLPSVPFRAGSADCHWLKFGPGLLRPEGEGRLQAWGPGIPEF